MHMQQLATKTRENEVSTDYSYGLVPNDPLRWDAENIYGCDCDPGWHGIDCAQQYCPFGDNPSSDGVAEVQTVTYTPAATIVGTETVQLKFRQATATLLAGDTVAQVKTKLETMLLSARTLRKIRGSQDNEESGTEVTVTLTDTNGAAAALLSSTLATTLRVSFERDYGDLPLLQHVAGTANTTAVVTGVTDGTYEYSECSDKGLCDVTTGTCACRSGWGSSDGKGGEGPIQDCGYRTPFLKAEA